MLKRIINSLSKESIKRLCATVIISFAVLMLIVIAYLLEFINLLVALLFTILFATILAISLMALMRTIAISDRKSESQQELEKVKAQLSHEEFTRVQFVPVVHVNGTITSYEIANLTRCLQVFEDFKVTHLAKIDNNDNIIVIAKDAAGNLSRPETMDPLFFSENYKVLK